MGIMSSTGMLLTFALEIYSWMILIRILLSWVNPDPYNPIVQFLIRATDPVLIPFRRLIPSIGGLDLSPIAALLAISLLKRLVAVIFVSTASGSGGSALTALFVDILYFVHLAVTLYMLLLVMRGGVNIYSWLTFRQGKPSNLDLRHPLMLFLFRVTEPLIVKVRHMIPTFSGLDVTPLVLAFATMVLLSLLQDFTAIFATPQPMMMVR